MPPKTMFATEVPKGVSTRMITKETTFVDHVGNTRRCPYTRSNLEYQFLRFDLVYYGWLSFDCALGLLFSREREGHSLLFRFEEGDGEGVGLAELKRCTQALFRPELRDVHKSATPSSIDASAPYLLNLMTAP